jgi:hypothetical protein
MADLVQFVRKEMEGYRLYTVVPRLLNFVDQLTNWYVRLNRRRIKGSDGAREALASLTALYEVRCGSRFSRHAPPSPSLPLRRSLPPRHTHTQPLYCPSTHTPTPTHSPRAVPLF